MRVLRWLLGWLAARPRASRASTHFGLEPLDTERVSHEIDLQAEARRLGRGNVPPTDAVEITAVEARVVQLVDRARQDYVAWARDRLTVLQRTIAEIDLGPLARRVDEADAVYEHQASALLESRAPVLTALAASLRSHKAELRAFRNRHGLARDARYPLSAQRVFLVFALFALVVGEGFLNAFFFAEGMDSGILGGWVHAGAFSLVNVLCAYAWGRHAVPQVHHIAWPRKLIGLGGMAGGVLTAVAIGLLLAHFRDAVWAGPEHAAAAALAGFLERPFGLQEVHSFILFGVSVLCALLALLDAYRLDDPYPEYGPLARRVRQAGEDYEEELADVRDALETLKDESLRSLQATLDLAETRLHRLHESIAYKAATEGRLLNALRDAANGMDALLRAFRDENRIARNTPPPAYFNASPPLPPIDLPSFDIEPDRARHEAQRAMLEGMRARANEVRMTVLAAFNRRRQTIKPLEEHFPAELREVVHEVARA